MTPVPILIVGGGISGLACAFRLKQLGLPVMLFEQSSRAGGLIESVAQDGFLFELGPQSFLGTERVRELIRALELEGNLRQADPRAARYVLLEGQLQEVPMSPPGLLTTSLLSAGTKLRLLSELLRRSRPPDEDESMADFVRRKFGVQLLERLAGPFVSGVYAGDPEKLSLRSAFPDVYRWEKDYGSVIRGAMKSRPEKGKPRPRLCSFDGGNETLVRRLREKLGDVVHLETIVESVQRGKTNGNSRFELRITQDKRVQSIAAEAVVLATPADRAARLLSVTSSRLAEALASIPYAPVAEVAAGYRSEQIGHSLSGFGFLVPRTEGLRLLGTVWESSLFPNRAPQGMAALTCFAGGATDPELVAKPEDQIAALIEQELAKVLTISGPPVTRIVQRYPRALPQYNVGHHRIVAGLREEVARFPGLFLAGNYLEGASVGGCVEHAFRVADETHAYVRSLSG